MTGKFYSGPHFNGPFFLPGCPETSFYEGSFFCGEFFSGGVVSPVVVDVPAGGSSDRKRKRRRDFGLRPIHPQSIFAPSSEVMQAQREAAMDAEIGVLLRKKLRTEDEEATLLILMAILYE
jgi:hypothetical protein